jgi:hypothetical protein
MTGLSGLVSHIRVPSGRTQASLLRNCSKLKLEAQYKYAEYFWQRGPKLPPLQLNVGTIESMLSVDLV